MLIWYGKKYSSKLRYMKPIMRYDGGGVSRSTKGSPTPYFFPKRSKSESLCLICNGQNVDLKKRGGGDDLHV